MLSAASPEIQLTTLILGPALAGFIADKIGNFRYGRFSASILSIAMSWYLYLVVTQNMHAGNFFSEK